MHRWICPRCGTRVRGETCRRCGIDRPAEPGRPPPERVEWTKPESCPNDGALLDDHRYCHRGRGYAAGTECPFSCPLCRGPLGWAGDCQQCHGTTTGRREDWTFPGQRYEFDGGHYKLVDPATMRPVCSPEDNAAAMRALRALLRRFPPPPTED
jgi:hypothetical protein